MATLRETRDRIRSVNSTKKITKAQELIATSRITKAQQRVEATQPYAVELKDVMSRLAAASSLDHPMLRERENAKLAAVLVVTSDRGMCGGYNNNVLKRAHELEEHLEESGYDVVRYVTGKKGVGFLDFRDLQIAGSWTDFSENPELDSIRAIGEHLVKGYIASAEDEVEWQEGLHAPEGQPVRGFDQVHVVYTEFESMLSQQPRVQRLLPIEIVYEDDEFSPPEMKESVGSGDISPDMDFEPDPDTLLDALLPQYFLRTLFQIYLESSASESAARRNAMKSATDNATELVKDLTRIANQARQAQITQEITEIISGAGALSDSGESD
ncbi:MAG TPA: F0F1 ATP synthase subunit gamma [Corynebacterium sp.]|nr:F0F1 ATP synthase subunit gamma [Corynebacterium sp.]